MKILLLLFLLTTSAFASVRLNLHFPEGELKQGSQVKAYLSLSPESLQGLQLQKLKAQTFAKAIYFLNVSPALKAEGQNEYRSEVNLIFIKVPEASVIKDQLAGMEVEINLGNITVIPTEAAEKLIFGNFEIPSRPKLMLWGSILLGLLLAAFLAWKLNNKWQTKSKLKKNKLDFKNTLTHASSYEDVVAVWKNKHLYLKTFPHLEEPFTKLELVLFKYQFKPYQSSAEKEEVVSAYRTFLNESEGGFRGI